MSNARSYKPSVVPVTSTWTEFLPVNAGRGPLILTNTGTTPVLFGLTETTAITIPVGIGFSFEDCEVPLNPLSCKVVSGTGQLTVWES